MPELAQAPADAHRRTVESSVQEVSSFLQEVLGQKLVAFMVGARDPKSVGRWAAGKTPPRDADTERRLRDAYHVFQVLQTEESPHTVRAWFVGLNPQLDDESPAVAISEGRTREVMLAAKAFLAGG